MSTFRISGALLLGASSLAAQTEASKFDTFDFAHRKVDSAAIYALPLADARIVRGILFGHHGRPFDDDADINAYLVTKPWYRLDAKFTNARLNAMEKANLDLIRGAEAAKHEFVQPGDLRYYRARSITVAMLGHHTQADWQLLTTELPAIHGQKYWNGEFGSAPCKPNDKPCLEEEEEDEEGSKPLQHYYDERYWYHAVDNAKPSYTPIERALIDTLTLARMLDAGLAVAPGTMYLFTTTAMVDSVLRGVSIHDLRILRNEVFARHGRRFTTPWLKDHFADQPWYRPRADFDIKELSDIERGNIALITTREDKFHESLSTTRFSQFAFDGLYPAVARQMRNEIFARHGRIFKDKALQQYFASFAWYKPDPAFKDSMLNPVERSNVSALTEYEERARQGMRYYAA